MKCKASPRRCWPTFSLHDVAAISSVERRSAPPGAWPTLNISTAAQHDDQPGLAQRRRVASAIIHSLMSSPLRLFHRGVIKDFNIGGHFHAAPYKMPRSISMTLASSRPMASKTIAWFGICIKVASLPSAVDMAIAVIARAEQDNTLSYGITPANVGLMTRQCQPPAATLPTGDGVVVMTRHCMQIS